jgi:hypothetical protein
VSIVAVHIVSVECSTTTQMMTTGELPALGDLIVMELPAGEQAPAGWTEIQGPVDRACWHYVIGGESWPTRFPSIVLRGAQVATDEGSGVLWDKAGNDHYDKGAGQ